MKTARTLALLGISLLAVQASADEATVLKTPKDQVSYSIGLQTGRHFRSDKIDVDADMFLKGLKDGVSGEKPLLSEKDLRRVMGSVLGQVRRAEAANRMTAIEENRKQSDAFLAENKTKEGVVALPNGLQYKILKAGDGRKPQEDSTVQVAYSGKLLNGTEFDRSEPGKPATLKLSQLIPGWQEALKLMPAGSKWQIFIPPQLAYGTRGAGNDIGPNQTLVFDLELVAVK